MGAHRALQLAFARRHGGTFVLRIEDTDAERSSWKWSRASSTGCAGRTRLGRGARHRRPHAPYFQSQRLEKPREHAHALVRDGRAYYCYCQPEEMQRKRADAEARGGVT